MIFQIYHFQNRLEVGINARLTDFKGVNSYANSK